MAQGKIKTKVQVPGKKGKHRQRHATIKNKKGARVIAPKKAKLIQAAKLKTGISKAVTARNEKEIISMAKSKEPKQLAIAANSTTATAAAGDGKKKKGGK